MMLKEKLTNWVNAIEKEKKRRFREAQKNQLKHIVNELARMRTLNMIRLLVYVVAALVVLFKFLNYLPESPNRNEFFEIINRYGENGFRIMVIGISEYLFCLALTTMFLYFAEAVISFLLTELWGVIEEKCHKPQNEE